MSDDIRTGGCLCGQLRYEAVGEPVMAGHCYCVDCRKASGSGFIPFMGYPADRLRVTGQTRHVVSRSFRGTDAVRNICPDCGSLVFGGILDVDAQHTVYAGSLDDPTLFRPRVALFNSVRPSWAMVPEGLTMFETMPVA